MKIFEISFFGITISPTYYALMYILGFVFAWIFMKKFFYFYKNSDIDELFFLLGIGVIIGGRIGYVLLYDFSFYINNFSEIFKIWKGGMSFHGGLVGVILSVIFFSKKYGYSFWCVIDHLAVIAPVGLTLGRIGNFLNNELYGFSPYYGPFPMFVNNIAHFPSPLLEMFLEGILLGGILFFLFFKKCHEKPKMLSGIFLLGYGISRIIVEFFRLPDMHIGYLFGTNFITIGMLYTIPMILGGIFLIFYKKKKITP